MRLFLFAVGSLLLVGVGFSLFQALSATGFQPFNALKDAEAGDGSDRKRAWLRHGLIVAQIVGSLALLCGATLCLRGMSKQLAVDVGFRSDRLAIAPLNLERVGFATSSVGSELEEITRRLSLIPGVEQVGVSPSEPLAGWDSNIGVPQLEGYENPDPGSAIMFSEAGVGPDVSAVKAELARIHPKLVQGEVCTLRDTMRNALRIQHTALRILGTLGGLALVLCMIGTYAVMAYVVTRRTREIGVRIALGATRGSVIRLILTAGLRLGFIALAIGLPLALSAAGFLRHQLAGISPFDPLSFIAVTLSILTTLICACWLPARRAARVDPMEALRYE